MMARVPGESNLLSRDRTARLLKELRALSRQIRMLKAEVANAERQDLEEQQRRLRPERARWRRR